MKLQIQNLTKTYGSKTALDNVNITLKNGVYGLLGANGAGKTTLMRLICGLQKPTKGKILLDGKEISLLGEKYRSYLGYLPQNFVYYSDFTAEDFLLYVAALKGIEGKKARIKSMELLEAVGLKKERCRKIKTFSGGMKHRLGIAQAMLNDPRILILDEPTTGLDPKERIRFRNLISSFSRDRIIILSTHIVSDVEYIADTIIMMKAGKVLHQGKAAEIASEITGCVWEYIGTAGEADWMNERFRVVNLKNLEDGRTLLRIVSETEPIKGAHMVEPNLEDLYFYYFEEEN